MPSRTVFVVLLLLSSACGSSKPAAGRPQPVPTAPVAGATAEGFADPDSIRWVRDSAEYHAVLYQVYRSATVHVEAEAARRAAGTWAVVLDADETVISNMTYQLERARQRLGYSPDSWRAWVKRREATALPGAAEFLSRVRTLGGRIAIVTNRLQSECDDTAAVFNQFSLVYDAMLCRPDGTPSDKNPRFEAVAAGKSTASASRLDIVAFVGDNILDFPALAQAVKARGAAGFSDFGVRYFLVPNPMYGSWQ